MISVYYTVNKTEWPESFYNKCINEFPEKMHPDLIRYRRWQDRQSVLCGKLLLKYGINMSGLESDFNTLEKTSFGKPYLKQGPEFNISHSGEYVICAISDKGETGIDIEEIQYHPDLKEFKSFFSLSELSKIIRSGNFADTFFEYWTKKEAVMKASGKGFSLHPSEISINGNRAYAEGKTWNLTDIQINKGYSCQLATENQEKILTHFIPVSHLY